MSVRKAQAEGTQVHGQLAHRPYGSGGTQGTSEDRVAYAAGSPSSQSYLNWKVYDSPRGLLASW